MAQESQTQAVVPAQQEQQAAPQQQVQPYHAHEVQPAAPPGSDALTVLDNHAVAFAVIVVAVVALAFYRPVARLIESLGQRKFKIGNVDVAAPGEQQAQADSGTVAKKAEFQIITGNAAVDSVRDSLAGKLAEFPQPEQHTRLLGFATDSYIRVDFFRAYINIYGSQLSLMRIANMSGGAVTRDVAKRTFDEVEARTEAFSYPFSEVGQWLDYPTRCAFVEVTDHAVILTQRGKLFLHFIVEEGLADFGLPNLSKL